MTQDTNKACSPPPPATLWPRHLSTIETADVRIVYRRWIWDIDTSKTEQIMHSFKSIIDFLLCLYLPQQTWSICRPFTNMRQEWFVGCFAIDQRCFCIIFICFHFVASHQNHNINNSRYFLHFFKAVLSFSKCDFRWSPWLHPDLTLMWLVLLYDSDKTWLQLVHLCHPQLIHKIRLCSCRRKSMSKEIGLNNASVLRFIFFNLRTKLIHF